MNEVTQEQINVIHAFGLLADFDWRAYQEQKMDEVKKIDSYLVSICKAVENLKRTNYEAQ